MEIILHIFLILSPLLLFPVLVLFLRLQGLLELSDSVNELRLVSGVSLIILLDTDGNFGNRFLQTNSIVLLVWEHSSGVLEVLDILVEVCALIIHNLNRCSKSIDLNFFLRNLHRHLMLLVIEHVFVVVDVGSCSWNSSFLRALLWWCGSWSSWHEFNFILN